MNLFRELKRRNVFRMGIAYVVVAWVLLQAIDFALDIISAPNWVMQVFFLAAVVGLPLVLIFSWVFELTPEGIKLESQIKPEDSVTLHTSRKLDRTIIVFLAFAVVLLLAERFMTVQDHSNQTPPTMVVTEQSAVIDQAVDNGIRSVAVLPFVNMSSDPEQEYFSDGLSEELLNRLAQNEQLRVAARTSSFQFKGQALDVGEIGRQLNVDNVLEGSVRKSANRLRITAQLIEVDTGYHLWSETFEREMNDVFAIQDEISAAITRALEVELDAVKTDNEQRLTENLDAYQLYLQARYLLAKRGGDNLLESVELFREATRLDENFSEAWSGMAFTYGLLPSYTLKITALEAGKLALASASKSIEIDPYNAEGYMALGRTQSQIDLQIRKARLNFEKAYQLAPNNVDIVNIYGDFLTLVGNFERAIEIENLAIELDPLAAVHYSDLAFLMLMMNRTEEALEPAETAIRFAPESFDRHDTYIVTLIRLGKYELAIKAIEMARDKLNADRGYVNGWLALLYFQQGDRETLREVLAERRNTPDYNSEHNIYTSITAFYLTWLDGVEAAIPFLEEAYGNRESLLAWPEYFYLPERISNDQVWSAFWEKPGLAELMEVRREYGPYENIGYWKEPPPQ